MWLSTAIHVVAPITEETGVLSICFSMLDSILRDAYPGPEIRKRRPDRSNGRNERSLLWCRDG
jgi:hypothetical protein